jgi:hypothetical protein
MSLNKQQLEAVNQANFPDNNSQLITPSKLREFNTDIIDAIQLTGSYATTGSNTFVGNQTITGDLNVSGVISASVLYVQTETASVIYSSGSNQFGDELTDIQTLSGSVKVQGSLTVNGVPVLTSSADISGFVTTGSFNQYTQSTNLRLNSLETNSASVNVSISNLNTTTASLSTSITNLNQFTQSQSALNGTFATTGSNTFTGNQIIDRASKLFTNGVYWTDPTAGFNNLEIINQGGGNLDFASLNGGRMRVVNTPLQLTGSALSSNSDISTSANIYAANLTGSGTIINTGSFATTGSNTFIGNQTISGSLLLNGTEVNMTGSSMRFTTTGTGSITFNAGGTIRFQGNTDFTSPIRTTFINVDNSGSNGYYGFNAETEGRIYQDFSGSVNARILAITGSGSTINTGSLMVTASAAGSTITFTKGDASTFSVSVDTGSAGTTIYEVVYTGENITKGDPLYISGSQGANPIVFKADASNPAKMPVTFVSAETIAIASTTEAIVLGLIEGIDLTGYVAGQEIYVAEGGGWSTSKPSGSNSITQLLGVVTKGGSGGKGLVLNPGPATLPGLDTGKIWVGGTNNQAVEITTASFATTGSNTFTGNQTVSASILLTGDLQMNQDVNAGILFPMSGSKSIRIQKQVGINRLAWVDQSNDKLLYLDVDTKDFYVSGNFQASLQNGYAWVGQPDGRSGQVATSSFSGTTINTGSFATTGSNIFRGDQIISGTQNHLLFKNDNGNELQLGVSDNGQGFDFKVTGSTSPGQQVWFIENQGGTWGNAFFGRMYVDSNLNVNQTLTASLQEGYVWVGNSLGKTSTVPTSSFGGGGALPSGLLSSSVTNFVDYSASVDSRINGIVTGTGFATTGSNSFNGNQNITGSVRISSQLIFGTASFGPTIQTLPSGTPLGDTGLQANAGESGSFTMRSLYGGGVGESTLEAYDTWPSYTKGGKIFAKSAGGVSIFGFGGDVNISGFDGNVSISGSSTSIQNVNFIPFSASVDARINAITGSGGGGGATLGANTFTGSQTIQNADLFMSGTILWPNGALIGPNQPSQQTVFSSQTALSISSSVNATISSTNLTLLSPRTDVRGVQTIGDVSGVNAGEVYLLARSGSFVLSNATATPTYAALSHLTSSQINANTNLIFKDNSFTGSTIISGSGNIFSNPTDAAAGRVNYIGGTSNLFLNGQADQLPQITSSAASVSGNRPTMNANIIAGSPAWTINQAANPGIHNYSNNIIAGLGSQWNFNTTGNTGQVLVQQNLGLGSTLTLNSPSRSIAQINAGESGSTLLTVSNNSIMGVLTYSGPVSASIHQITQNSIQGNAVLNIQSQSRVFNMNANIINGGVQYNDNTVFAPTLGSNNTFTNNNINGALTINQRASSSITLSNNNLNSWNINNDFDASSITQANLRFLAINGNTLFGVIGNNLYSSGSMGAIATQKAFIGNIFGGSNISASVISNGVESNMMSTIGVGHDLHVVGTARRNASNLAGAGETQGSAFFGRYNKLGQGFNTTAEVIFAVGTGTSGSAGITRKTGFLIDSGSNSFFEGAVNISGSLLVNGTPITSLTTGSFATTGSNSFVGANTFSGSVAFTGSVVGNVVALGITSNTASMDFNSGNYFTLTLADNATTHISASNVQPGVSATLVITTGTNSTASLAPTLLQPSGLEYSATVGTGKKDVLSIVAVEAGVPYVVSTKNMV